MSTDKCVYMKVLVAKRSTSPSTYPEKGGCVHSSIVLVSTGTTSSRKGSDKRLFSTSGRDLTNLGEPREEWVSLGKRILSTHRWGRTCSLSLGGALNAWIFVQKGLNIVCGWLNHTRGEIRLQGTLGNFCVHPTSDQHQCHPYRPKTPF